MEGIKLNIYVLTKELITKMWLAWVVITVLLMDKVCFVISFFFVNQMRLSVLICWMNNNININKDNGYSYEQDYF